MNSNVEVRKSTRLDYALAGPATRIHRYVGGLRCTVTFDGLMRSSGLISEHYWTRTELAAVGHLIDEVLAGWQPATTG